MVAAGGERAFMLQFELQAQPAAQVEFVAERDEGVRVFGALHVVAVHAGEGAFVDGFAGAVDDSQRARRRRIDGAVRAGADVEKQAAEQAGEGAHDCTALSASFVQCRFLSATSWSFFPLRISSISCSRLN